jgi:endonuclease/exonuclease/phosphatase family metal-dependent hydrolase
MSGYDVVGLQEVDAGSYRTGYVNQTEFLAASAGFEHWYSQTNRRLGRIAQQSLGVLSHLPLIDVQEHRLPGRIPGRGAMLFSVQTPHAVVSIIIVHLALGRYARQEQMEFLIDLINDSAAIMRNLIVLGDFNCEADNDELRRFCQHCDLVQPIDRRATYPSWRPSRQIDHVLVSKRMPISSATVLDHRYSDHRPVLVDLELKRRDTVSVPAVTAAGASVPQIALAT